MQTQMYDKKNAESIHKAFFILAIKTAEDIVVKWDMSEHENFEAHVVI
jgi:hypothetical protein